MFELGNGIMDNPGDAKYGMSEDQMAEAYTRLMKLGAEEFGIHSFLASNTVTDDYYPKLAGILFELAVRLHEAHRRQDQVHQPVRRRGHCLPPRPAQQRHRRHRRRRAQKVMRRSSCPLGWAMWPSLPRWAASCWRPTAALVTTAIHEKHIYKEYIGVDACAANLMRPAMYGAYHHITVLGKEDAPCDHKYDVVGGLCENNDKFAIDRMLPEIDKGDILFIHDAGAHGFSMGYNYNGKLRSAEVLLKPDGSFQKIRRAETPADYFATFDFTSFFKK